MYTYTNGPDCDFDDKSKFDFTIYTRLFVNPTANPRRAGLLFHFAPPLH